MFSYCLNNPVLYKDRGGELVELAVVASVGLGEILFDLCISALVVLGFWEISRNPNAASDSFENKSNNQEQEATYQEPEIHSVSTPSNPPPPNNNRKNDGTPKNNQRQNKQIDDICRKYGLDKKQRRILHNDISHQNYSYHEIVEIAKSIVGLQ